MPVYTAINADPFLLFFGSFYIVLGLSAFFAKKAWTDFMNLMSETDAVNLILGILLLPVSLFIVVFYNNWSELGPIILMVTGYIGLIKSMLLLLRPQLFQKLMRNDFARKWVWLDGLSGIILGAAMLLL